jgi:hypothetical protein
MRMKERGGEGSREENKGKRGQGRFVNLSCRRQKLAEPVCFPAGRSGQAPRQKRVVVDFIVHPVCEILGLQHHKNLLVLDKFRDISLPLRSVFLRMREEIKSLKLLRSTNLIVGI